MKLESLVHFLYELNHPQHFPQEIHISVEDALEWMRHPSYSKHTSDGLYLPNRFMGVPLMLHYDWPAGRFEFVWDQSERFK